MGTDTGMGGAITAVAATTTVGTGVVTMVGIAATTMVGAIIAIGGELRLHQHLNRLAIKTGKRSVNLACGASVAMPGYRLGITSRPRSATGKSSKQLQKE